MVKALGQKSRDLGLSPSWCSPFPAVLNCSRENYSLKHRQLFNALEIQENQIPEMIFEENKVKETYFDKYEGIQSEISQVTRFDENTDLSTTYLGK